MPPTYIWQGIGVRPIRRARIHVHAQQTAAVRVRPDRQVPARNARDCTGSSSPCGGVDAQDNIWAVDEGTNMVIKFNPQGKW